jgi:hypothetical protein
MTLLQWIQTQDTRDTVELRNRANARPIISTTPQPPIDVPREAYSHEVVIRDIVHARYGPLSDYAGLTPKERFDLLRSRMDAAFAAALDQAGKNQALYDATTIKSVNDMAKDEDGGMSHPNFLQENDAVPQPDIIEYGQSPAEENGWGSVTGDMIEEALRQ